MRDPEKYLNGSSEQIHRVGTSFKIHESISHTLKDFRDSSPRISKLKLKTNDFQIVLINTYTSSKEKVNEEKEEFYSTLDDTSIVDIKIVLADFNAKISKEALYRAVAWAYAYMKLRITTV